MRQVRAASFVSILVEVAQVRRNGLPSADYFIWNDDLEYTARLLKHRIGLYVPASVVVHKTRAAASATDDPGIVFITRLAIKFGSYCGREDYYLWIGYFTEVPRSCAGSECGYPAGKRKRCCAWE